MFFNLIGLTTWFDIVPVLFTILSIVAIQAFSDYIAKVSLETPETDANKNTTNEGTTTSKRSSVSSPTSPTNGKLFKQKSEHQSTITSEDLSSPLSSANSSPTSSARNSINSPTFSNGQLSHMPSIDMGDEYHEDEDTLSLENLFPCDQTDIYASKKICFIIDELIQTEANYVNNLQKGLRNYGDLQKRENLPEPLKGEVKQRELLGNIESILKLHEQQVLPMMLRNQRDLKQLFDDFAGFIDKNHFYCYVTFMMNKKASMQLRQENREYFVNLQNEINDKLGIDSFLVQPVQRLTRYPLLLQQFISEFYKSGISCKPVLVSVCKLETRIRRVLEVFNQAEEIPAIEELDHQINLQKLGDFKRATEFEAYHHRSRKRYRAKVFLFEACILCAEIRKKHLNYRQYYSWECIELELNHSKCIRLLLKNEQGTKDEYEFSAPEAISVTQWLRSARHITEESKLKALRANTITVPMFVVVGVVINLWLLWHYALSLNS